MKLKEFNIENTSAATKRGTPKLSIYKSGMLVFNKYASEQLKLEAGKQIKLHQDEEDETCWYLELVKDKGFLLKTGTGGNKGGFAFASSALARQITESLDGGGSMLIAGKPTDFKGRTLWGLLSLPKV